MADVVDAAKAVRAEVWHMTGTRRLAQAREAVPELLRLVDELVAALDAEDGGPVPIYEASGPAPGTAPEDHAE